MDLLLFWCVVWSVVGALVGSSRGQMASGIVWSLLLGPIGVLITLALPNLKKQEEDDRRSREISQQAIIQKQQLEELRRLSAPASAPAQRIIPPPPGAAPSYRIAKDGNDLGDVSIPAIKQMLATGGLLMQDYYFDLGANEWKPLDCLPVLVA